MRFTATTVEIFHRGSRIAAHARSLLKGRHTTIDAHMTPAHQRVAGWNARRLLDWAQKVGPDTHATVESMLSAGTGFRVKPRMIKFIIQAYASSCYFCHIVWHIIT